MPPCALPAERARGQGFETATGYLNDIVEQDHRAIKRRVRARQGFRSFDAAARTIQVSTVNMIRKG